MNEERAGEQKPRRDWLTVTQTIFTIVTPVILAIVGVLINHTLSQIRTDIERVDKMGPLIDRMAQEGDPPKAKMSVVAMYELTKTDPNLIVSIVLASGKEELLDLLLELYQEDAMVQELVARKLENREKVSSAGDEKVPSAGEEKVPSGADQQSVIEKSAIKVIQQARERTEGPISKGWCYLGKYNKTYDKVYWEDTTLDLGGALRYEQPKEGQKFTLGTDVYVRAEKPTEHYYKLGKAKGVAKKGRQLKIEEVVLFKPEEVKAGIPDAETTRVWARVVLVPKKPKE